MLTPPLQQEQSEFSESSLRLFIVCSSPRRGGELEFKLRLQVVMASSVGRPAAVCGSTQLELLPVVRVTETKSLFGFKTVHVQTKL